jgi:serine/threonine protein kinase
MIGKGSVSNVYLVKNKTEGQPYAMKSLRKDTVIEKELL